MLPYSASLKNIQITYITLYLPQAQQRHIEGMRAHVIAKSHEKHAFHLRQKISQNVCMVFQ